MQARGSYDGEELTGKSLDMEDWLARESSDSGRLVEVHPEPVDAPSCDASSGAERGEAAARWAEDGAGAGNEQGGRNRPSFWQRLTGFGRGGGGGGGSQDSQGGRGGGGGDRLSAGRILERSVSARGGGGEEYSRLLGLDFGESSGGEHSHRSSSLVSVSICCRRWADWAIALTKGSHFSEFFGPLLILVCQWISKGIHANGFSPTKQHLLYPSPVFVLGVWSCHGKSPVPIRQLKTSASQGGLPTGAPRQQMRQAGD
jgi:hypothetical protein